jgi:pyruvate kinase
MNPSESTPCEQAERDLNKIDSDPIIQLMHESGDRVKALATEGIVMGDLSDAEFLSQVWTLYQILVNQAVPFPLQYPNSHHHYSAHNLLAYLFYKNNINLEFITALHRRGLQLSSIQHVVHSLRIICSNLGLISAYPINHIEKPQMLVNHRKKDILGLQLPPEAPHIMLTLDAKMIGSTMIEDLLKNGMTIARINCAYDEESVWDKMIQTIRHAEESLRNMGQYGDRKCQIYMDLAGPKVRIGALPKTTHPLKITVRKDLNGQPIRDQIGFISAKAPVTKLLNNSVYDFELAVLDNETMFNLQEGDYLAFIDVRNKKRRFLIDKVMPSGLVVVLGKTSYINENTILQNPKHQIALQVHHLEKKPVRTQVKKGDTLRIYSGDKLPADLPTENGVIGISVTLPEALANIKNGHSIYIDDGKVHGIVTDYNKQFIDIEILFPETPFTLKENKGINLPDSNIGLAVSALTKKDEQDLAFICRHSDILGYSFVNHPNDLRKLKYFLKAYQRTDIAIIAKIETKQAVSNFSNLLFEGLTFAKFGVMIARGDLAVEISFQQLSVVQEEILQMCRAAHTPVILATQILDTLAKKGNPSRPELADLSFGSEFDCLMLNKGPFIKEAVGFSKDTLHLISQVKEYKYSITRYI